MLAGADTEFGAAAGSALVAAGATVFADGESGAAPRDAPVGRWLPLPLDTRLRDGCVRALRILEASVGGLDFVVDAALASKPPELRAFFAAQGIGGVVVGAPPVPPTASGFEEALLAALLP